MKQFVYQQPIPEKWFVDNIPQRNVMNICYDMNTFNVPHYVREWIRNTWELESFQNGGTYKCPELVSIRPRKRDKKSVLYKRIIQTKLNSTLNNKLTLHKLILGPTGIRTQVGGFKVRSHNQLDHETILINL